MAEKNTKASENTEEEVVEETMPKEEVVEETMPKEEKYVTIRLPRIPEKNSGEVVWLNDRRFLIKRGVDVVVPEGVAEILAESERLKEVAYSYIDKETSGE